MQQEREQPPVRPGTIDDAAQTILKVQDKEWEFNIMIHQLVNNAYFMVINRNYILRSDFNGEAFTAPMSLQVLIVTKTLMFIRMGSVIRLDSVIPTLVYL